MKRFAPRPASVAFAVPAIALPLVLAVASALVLNRPLQTGNSGAPISPETGDGDAAAAQPDARTYLPFYAPVHVTLPGGRGRLKIELAAALRADLPKNTFERLEEAPEPILAVAADVVLDLASSLPGDWDLQHLRRALPAPLAEAMNAAFAAERTLPAPGSIGSAGPILEILITEWAHAP